MFAFLIFVIAVSSLTYATIDAEDIASSQTRPRDQEANYCLLPPYPEHGRYTFSNHPYATPGERYPSVKLDISCDPGYKNDNSIKSIFCFHGEWSAFMPTCVRDMQGFCPLPTDDLRVEFRCLSLPGAIESSQECKSFVPSGAVVTPICRSPGYFSLRSLSKMHCRDGMWDYNPICKPACGLTTQHRQFEGSSSNQLELPWHAVIYERWSENIEQSCSGSLITATKILSAAYCFYKNNGELFPTNIFVVAVNKMYLSYNDPRDRNSQRSDVIDIKIPTSYRDSDTHYEDNIAIAIVETAFFFHLSVRPVCLDFDNHLDRTQLTEGNSGKAVRRYIDGNNKVSDVLNAVDFPYVKYEDCYNILPSDYRQYLTKDIFCTGYRNGTSLSASNTGNGLAFLESTTQRYYLQGLFTFSFVGTDGNTIMILHSSIVKHEHFIKEHL